MVFLEYKTKRILAKGSYGIFCKMKWGFLRKTEFFWAKHEKTQIKSRNILENRSFFVKFPKKHWHFQKMLYIKYCCFLCTIYSSLLRSPFAGQNSKEFGWGAFVMHGNTKITHQSRGVEWIARGVSVYDGTGLWKILLREAISKDSTEPTGANESGSTVGLNPQRGM